MKSSSQIEYERIVPHLVPKHFLFATIEQLKVDTSGLTRMPGAIQEALYAKMKANPLGSYAFFAPAGFSKTTCSYALYRRALRENMEQRFKTGESEFTSHLDRYTPFYDPQCFVWRKSVPDLLQELFTRMEHPDAPLATITTEKIEKAIQKGFVPRVFMDEIDKIKPSDFALGTLYRIIDAVYRHHGQLVLDTNFSKAQFQQTFGDPIARRVRDMCDLPGAGGMWEVGF